jgi:HEAT repeat protein
MVILPFLWDPGDQESSVHYLFKHGVRGLAVASVFGLTLPAMAQEAGPSGQDVESAAVAREQHARWTEMLRDFNHFTRINRADVAAGVGRQLLESGISPTQLVDLVESVEGEERFLSTISRAMQMPELEGTAAQLVRTYERGRMERVRDPREITRNIELLSGVQRARSLGRERLVAAGEYAMPQLIEALIQRNDMDLQSQAHGLLVNMGQQAIMPLAAALPNLDPASQELVVDVLGLIGYRTALPFVFDVMLSTRSDRVRAACERAAGRIGPGYSVDVAELYRDLGEGYYARKTELTSFPGEEHQLLWSYLPGAGLTMTAIRTEVYNEAMAMRMAERSLELQPRANGGALSLWLASNFSREIRTPEGYENPAYGPDRRDAMYFAVAAGPSPAQAVLARALDGRNTQLARQAIAAIAQTAGGSELWSMQDGRQPLLEALRYPNRRVQYEAALALGKAQPTTTFVGAERVVPLLASAVREADAQYAVVVSGNRELADWTRQILEREGYRVLPTATALTELVEPIAEVPGVDLIVSHLPPDATVALVNEVRGIAKLAATPILAVTAPRGAIDLSRRYESDALVEVRPGGITEAQLVRSTEDLVEAGAGGRITADEARMYAGRALAVLRDLTISRNEVLDVGDAALPLIAALGETEGDERLRVADVLSRVGQRRVQVALADAALSAGGEERIVLLGMVADSAKRFGNLLEARQVRRVMDLASDGSDPEATAAAALVGSLNLPNNNLVPLILGSR